MGSKSCIEIGKDWVGSKRRGVSWEAHWGMGDRKLVKGGIRLWLWPLMELIYSLSFKSALISSLSRKLTKIIYPPMSIYLMRTLP